MLDAGWAPVAGALVGLVVGLTGVGGGALMAPILLAGFGMPLPAVVATDLLFASVTKLAAGGMHIGNALVDWQVARRLWLGSLTATAGVLAGIRAGWLFEDPGPIVRLLGLLVVLSSLSLIFGGRVQQWQRSRRLARPVRFKALQQPLTVLAGAVLGALVTMTSVGAGALGAVFLRGLYPLRMEPRRLVATDTVHAIPVALLGGFSFLVLGMTDVDMLWRLLAGSIPAALLGGWCITRFPAGFIRQALAASLFLAGVKLLAG